MNNKPIQRQKTWVTSDFHFGHKLAATLRGFANTDEMDEILIENFNNLVSSGDRVYILGDVGLCSPENLNLIMKRLKGQKFLIRGNHDRSAEHKLVKGNFIWTRDIQYMKIDNTKIMMCHYPMASWRASAKGSFHLHGHCHGSLKISNGRKMDVGVDTNNLKPYSWTDIKEILGNKDIHYTDHHGPFGTVKGLDDTV